MTNYLFRAGSRSQNSISVPDYRGRKQTLFHRSTLRPSHSMRACATTDFPGEVRDVVFSVIQITGVLSNLRDNGVRCERSHRLAHGAEPKGRSPCASSSFRLRPRLSDHVRRHGWAVTALSETYSATAATSAHHQFRVKDADSDDCGRGFVRIVIMPAAHMMDGGPKLGKSPRFHCDPQHRYPRGLAR
jgi:hypothetical protein